MDSSKDTMGGKREKKYGMRGEKQFQFYASRCLQGGGATLYSPLGGCLQGGKPQELNASKDEDDDIRVMSSNMFHPSGGASGGGCT